MARQVGIARAWAEYAALAPLWGSLRALPLRRAVRVGAAIGSIAMRLDLLNRSIAIRNLEIAFPQMELAARLRILRDTYQNYGRMAAEWIHFFELDRSNIEKFVDYEDRQYWDRAIERSDGRGILVLTAHFGNFELLSVAHSIYGNPIALVHRPNRNPLIDRNVTKRRIRFGNLTVPRRGAARDVLKLLHKNWMVAIPLDLDTRAGVFVDFFSAKAATADALARLAMSTGAPVLPAFMVRHGKGTRHSIRILPDVEIVRTGDRQEAIRENTQRFTTIIQQMVERHPDHWNWVHRRWKTRPAGEHRFY